MKSYKIIKLKLLFLTALFALLSSSLLNARTLIGGGAIVNLQKRVTSQRNISGMNFGVNGFTELGTFPGNVAMGDYFSYFAGSMKTKSGKLQYAYRGLSAVHSFKYYFPTGFSLKGWYKRYIYKYMNLLNPFLGLSAGFTIDTYFSNRSNGEDEYSKEFDMYIGMTTGFNVLFFKDLSLLIEVQYLKNLTPDDSDIFTDDNHLYGHMVQILIGAAYHYDL